MSDTPAARTEPRPAATVILARAAAPPHGGLELYMTRRSSRSAFAPDAYVFPGGVLDAAQDCTAAMHARTLGLDDDLVRAAFRRPSTPPELPNDLPAPGTSTALGLYAAALRELFEEAGILIARTAAGIPVDAGEVFSREVQEERERIRAGRSTFADFLLRRDWLADAGGLTLFSHWITPASEPRRYDTHFFFAVAPPDQAGRADAFETHDGLWIAPADALERFARGRFHLVYPTIKHLERLAPFASPAEAHAFAQSKPILTILPWASEPGGFSMPPDLEHAW